jgi:hypothetical protein
MNRLLLWTPASVTAFAILLMAVRMVGGLAVPPAIQELEVYQCTPQPCWHDIRPGHTTFEQAERILRADSTFVTRQQNDLSGNMLCWRAASDPTWQGCIPSWSKPLPDNVVRTVGLWPSEVTVRLGDAIVLFGEPTSSQLCWTINPPANVPGPLVTVYIHFKDNITAVAYNPLEPKETRFDPGMTVYQLTYRRDAVPADAPAWRGFTEPSHQGCAS